MNYRVIVSILGAVLLGVLSENGYPSPLGFFTLGVQLRSRPFQVRTAAGRLNLSLNHFRREGPVGSPPGHELEY